MSFKIPFWSKDSGSLMSHASGLTPEQVAGLQELKEGDRLILWHNKVEYPKDPSYCLKVYRPVGATSSEAA